MSLCDPEKKFYSDTFNAFQTNNFFQTATGTYTLSFTARKITLFFWYASADIARTLQFLF